LKSRGKKKRFEKQVNFKKGKKQGQVPRSLRDATACTVTRLVNRRRGERKMGKKNLTTGFEQEKKKTNDIPGHHLNGWVLLN